MAERRVTVIPQTINPKTRTAQNAVKKRRVAGYARVSTDSDEQFTSFEAQTDYYTKMIKANPAWEFVGVYTDEGISGTNTKHREGFNTMIADALAGKIDLIVTKSVSRFARNTVDSLVTIRELKAHNCEVFFEKEAIYTFDGKGELLLTIMSSLAQEESRSISENVTWGQRKRFSDGKISMPYKAFLGYDKGDGKDALPVVNDEQAVIVRRIYAEFMKGTTVGGIARLLTAEGIPSPRGKTKWAVSTVESILTNEKYKGAALLQKKFTTDFLTHKMKKNEGEVQQYYIENSHEAIIPPEEWDAVQDEFRRRKGLGRSYSGNGVYASKLVCADCGALYGSKVWHSTDKYRRVIWQCNSKYKGDKRCTTPHLDEEDIKTRFVKAYNEVYDDRESIISDCKTAKAFLADTSGITAAMTEAAAEAEIAGRLIDELIAENATTAQDQEEYNARFNSLNDRYNEALNRYTELEREKARKEAQGKAIDKFITGLRKRTETITQFDESLWLACIENVLVSSDGVMVFRFHGGTEVEG